jgi:L-iditol 2-dehydrogenase
MKALVLAAYNHLEIQDLPEPRLGPTDVLVRVKACGICGSDVHGMDGSTGRRRPPIVMGHEAAGVVERVGEDVQDYRSGDRVTFDSTIYNPDSYFSRRGLVNLCDDRRVLGVSCEDYRQHGAFAEFVAVPQHILYRLPASLTFEQAAMIEPVAIALHARRLTPIEPEDTALVYGTGLIGMMMVQVLRQTPVKRIVAVDVDDRRLTLARELGAHEIVNTTSTDVPEAVRGLTGGRGADIVFECVGAEVTVRHAILSARKGATVTLVGNIAKDVSMPLQAIVTRQLRLQGSCSSAGEYPEALELVASGRVNVDRFISAAVPLEQGAEWFDRLYNRTPGVMKVILKP